MGIGRAARAAIPGIATFEIVFVIVFLGSSAVTGEPYYDDARNAFILAAAVPTVGWVVTRAVQGRGDYHINQFRMYFKPSREYPGETELIAGLHDGFADAFKATGQVSVEYVEAEDAFVFHLDHRFKRFLRRRLGGTDSVHLHDVAGWWFWANTRSDHFLSGTRSWTVCHAADTASNGEPDHKRDDGDIYFFETAALERASTKLAAWAPTTRDIAGVWQAFLIGIAQSPLVEEVVEASPPTTELLLGGVQWEFGGNNVWQRQARWTPEIGITASFIPDFNTVPEHYRHRLWSLHPALELEYNDSRPAPPDTPTSGAPPDR